MKKRLLCVYAICKNEEHFVDAWMDSMSEADMIIVTDTGSTDKTVEKLRARGAIVYQNTIKPWRFDVARNISLGYVPDDVDICLCTDLDEILEPGWRVLLEQAWVDGTHTAQYQYNWSLKADGSPDVQFVYFKCHTKKDYRWKYPVHECLAYTGKQVEQKIFVPGMVLNHYPDLSKSRGSYLPLLELAAVEMPLDDRIAYYLGREYMYARMWQESIDELKRHLSLKSSTWAEERCASMRWIASCYHQMERPQEALQWYYKAIAEVATMRDPYIECAKMAYDRSDWSLCFSMSEEALRIKEKSSTYINMGYAWDDTPYDLAAIAAYHKGLYQHAYQRAKEALQHTPSDERLQKNVVAIKARLELTKDKEMLL